LDRPFGLTNLSQVDQFGDVLMKHNRRCIQLPDRDVVLPVKVDDVRNPALKAMQRVHDGYAKLPLPRSCADRHDDLHRFSFETFLPNSQNVEEEVDLDRYPADRGLNDGGLWRRIVVRGQEKLAFESSGELPSCSHIAEIIHVLRRVRPIVGEFWGGVRVSLGPKIKRLSPNDKRLVVEAQDRRNLVNQRRIKLACTQTARLRLRMEERDRSRDANMLFRPRKSAWETAPERRSRSSCSRESCFSRRRAIGSYRFTNSIGTASERYLFYSTTSYSSMNAGAASKLRH
jgi:hypothetical protein